jgi:hypothetical protein
VKDEILGYGARNEKITKEEGRKKKGGKKKRTHETAQNATNSQ